MMTGNTGDNLRRRRAALLRIRNEQLSLGSTPDSLDQHLQLEYIRDMPAPDTCLESEQVWALTQAAGKKLEGFAASGRGMARYQSRGSSLPCTAHSSSSAFLLQPLPFFYPAPFPAPVLSPPLPSPSPLPPALTSFCLLLALAPLPCAALQHSAEAVVDACERALRLATTNEFTLPQLDLQGMEARWDTQMELETGGVQVWESVWAESVGWGLGGTVHCCRRIEQVDVSA